MYGWVRDNATLHQLTFCLVADFRCPAWPSPGSRQRKGTNVFTVFTLQVPATPFGRRSTNREWPAGEREAGETSGSAACFDLINVVFHGIINPVNKGKTNVSLQCNASARCTQWIVCSLQWAKILMVLFIWNFVILILKWLCFLNQQKKIVGLWKYPKLMCRSSAYNN